MATHKISPEPAPHTSNDRAHIIVFGNEKGGSGKSTAAMHTAIALLRLGYKVGSIDLDARQGTLTRYMKNRFDNIARHRRDLPSPAHMAIPRSTQNHAVLSRTEEFSFLEMALDELGRAQDFIVIDTPGTDSYLSRAAHSFADTLVTPMNDSLIDLDLLATIDPDTLEIGDPSVYAKMVKEQMQTRDKRDGRQTRWIVMRNRLSHLGAKNKELLGDLLPKIAQREGFEIAYGFGERVIFKELFLKGLTLLDLKEDENNGLTLSEVAARQEVRLLIKAIAPQKIKGHRKPRKS